MNGALVTATLEYDGGRQVTVYVPPSPAAAPPTARTAVFGASAGGELALALRLRHPDIYGAVFSARRAAAHTAPRSGTGSSR